MNSLLPLTGSEMSFIINTSDNLFLIFEKLPDDIKGKALTWSPNSIEERPATLKELTSRLLKRHPLSGLNTSLLAKKLVNSIVQKGKAEIEFERLKQYFVTFDDLVFNIEKKFIRVNSNLKRLVWLAMASSDRIPEIESDDQFVEISLFFHHLLLSERYYEGNDYSLESANYVKDFSTKNSKLLERLSFYPSESHSPSARFPEKFANFSTKEMGTKFLGDMILTPASAKGYQDPQFSPKNESTIFLLEMPENETEKLVWFGHDDEIPEGRKKYYVHPEATELHARNGINLSNFKKTEFLKTSSPRSFIQPLADIDLALGIKLSLPRWFGGAIRLIAKEQIELSILVDEFLRSMPEVQEVNRIEVWSDFAGCLPAQGIPFGMLYRKVKLLEGFEIYPFFSIGNLPLSFSEKMDLLQKSFNKILFYAFEHGVIFESHAQNLLLQNKEGTIYRDNGGVFISPDLLQLHFGDQKAESMIEWASSMPAILFDRLWRLFCGSCVYSTFCDDQMPRTEVEKIYEVFFSNVKSDMSKYSSKVCSARNMREACLMLDEEFRFKFCGQSQVHRIKR